MDKTAKCISVYCDEVLYLWIRDLAAAEGRSMSQWIARRLDAARVKSQTPAAKTGVGAATLRVGE
jgi:hypothetical protein